MSMVSADTKIRTVVKNLFIGIFFLISGKTEALTLKYGVLGVPIICIPAYDMPRDARTIAHSSLNIEAGDGPVDLVPFAYSTFRFINAVPMFKTNRSYSENDPPNMIFGEVSYVTDVYKHRSLGLAAGPDVENIWNKSGKCVHPFINRISSSSIFLAQCNNVEFWHILFDRDPMVAHRPHDVFTTVLGECTHMSGGIGAHASAELENCVRRIYVDNFRIDYEFQLENAEAIPEMDAFLFSRVHEWERICAHK